MPARAGSRLGRGYARAIGNALAEQVVDSLDLRRADTVVDLLADSGGLSRTISRLGGAPRRILACEIEGGIDDQEDGESVEHLRIEPGRVPLAGASCDAAVSLLTLGFAAGPELLAEARRIVREPGHVAILVFDEAEPPAHERLLRDALAGHGIASPFLQGLLCRGLVSSAREQGYAVLPVRDLARFDGPRWFWETMVEERPLGRELAHLDGLVRSAVSAHAFTALRPYMAADDTIRIPVSAVLLRA